MLRSMVSSPLRSFLTAATIALVAGIVAAQPEITSDTCGIDGVQRILAVGDVHGAYDGFVQILRTAGIVDEKEQWAGGKTYFVQNGDVVDRGADSRKALDLLRRLEKDAPKTGGRVLPLIGNHEVMRMMGELRDTNPAEIDAFRTNESEQIAPQGAAPGLIEMVQAFSADGDYGKWLRSHSAVARINGILFLHGGISPRVASQGCAGLNAGIAADLSTGFEEMRKAPLASLAMSEDGPLWYRGLAREVEDTFAPTVDEILRAVQARAIVIGHTPTEDGRIRQRFGGRVVQIDTGMLTSVYKNGRPSALEIVGDRWTAIYADGRQPLTSPPLLSALPPAAARR
jgi:Calcineurin-like phosphoesterase